MIILPDNDGPAQTVLVVDDEPGTLDMVSSALTADGYHVQKATRGDEVIPIVQASPPDVLLVEVTLPGMDGIEICRRLHDDPTTAHIPVILMTAHRRREKRLDGISAGAQDFLLKPLDIPDLCIRVRNAADTKRLYDESQEQLATITELEQLRDSLVHMIVHDLKSPLTAVMGNLQLMDLFLSDEVDQNTRNALEGGLAGARKMDEMVGSILAVSKLESGTLELNREASSMKDVAQEAIALMGPKADRIKLFGPNADWDVQAHLDSDLIQRVLQNLLSNALAHSPDGEDVVVRVSEEGHSCRVAVADQGPGVPEESRDLIFEKFGQAGTKGKGRKSSVGLGLAFCKLAVEAHGGKIGVEAPEESGSIFWFEIPGPGAGS